MCWMGAAFEFVGQRLVHGLARGAVVAENTRTLIRPWALSAASASFLTAGVRPSLPIMTTGSRWWASARCTLRCGGGQLNGGHPRIIGAGNTNH